LELHFEDLVRGNAVCFSLDRVSAQGAGMVLAMDGFEATQSEMRVDLGGGDVGVA
jgi:hypothetical protein